MQILILLTFILSAAQAQECTFQECANMTSCQIKCPSVEHVFGNDEREYLIPLNATINGENIFRIGNDVGVGGKINLEDVTYPEGIERRIVPVSRWADQANRCWDRFGSDANACSNLNNDNVSVTIQATNQEEIAQSAAIAQEPQPQISDAEIQANCRIEKVERDGEYHRCYAATIDRDLFPPRTLSEEQCENFCNNLSDEHKNLIRDRLAERSRFRARREAEEQANILNPDRECVGGIARVNTNQFNNPYFGDVKMNIGNSMVTIGNVTLNAVYPPEGSIGEGISWRIVQRDIAATGAYGRRTDRSIVENVNNEPIRNFNGEIVGQIRLKDGGSSLEIIPATKPFSNSNFTENTEEDSISFNAQVLDESTVQPVPDLRYSRVTMKYQDKEFNSEGRVRGQSQKYLWGSHPIEDLGEADVYNSHCYSRGYAKTRYGQRERTGASSFQGREQ